MSLGFRPRQRRDRGVWELKHLKHQKLFCTYSEAIRLAQLILRRYDYSLTNMQNSEEDCPSSGWICSLTLRALCSRATSQTYGNQIRYQEPGHTGYPDFICYDPLLVMDTKVYPPLQGQDQDRLPTSSDSSLAMHATESSSRNVPQSTFLAIEEGNETNPFLRDGKPIPINELLHEIKKEVCMGDSIGLAVPLPTLR